MTSHKGLKKKHMGIIAGVLAALAALAFVIYRWRTSGFSWQKFYLSLSQVDWSWMALALVLILGTYVGRALRWEVMVRPLTANPSLWRVLTATCIGFTAVLLFGRAGEPVRPYLIARKEGVTFSSQVAAWVVERMLDLLMVLLIFGIALTQVSRSSIQPSPKIQAILQAGGVAAGVAGTICLALLVGLALFRGRVQERLMDGLAFLPEAVLARVRGFLGSFTEGMQSIRTVWSVGQLIGYSALEWAMIAGSFFCVFRAFPVTAVLHPTDVFIVMGFVAFGSVLQIPGVGGGMQIVTALVLTEFYGLDLEAASSVALVLWIVSFVAILPIGLALAFHEGIKWRNLRHIDSGSPT